MLNFKPTFSLSSFTFIKRLFSSSSLSATRVISSVIEITNRMYNLPIRRVATGNGIKSVKSRQGRETGI